MLSRAERKAKLRALGEARKRKAAKAARQAAGAASPGATPRRVPGGAASGGAPRLELTAGGPEEAAADALASPRPSVASRPPTPRRLSRHMDQLRLKKEAAARAQQLEQAQRSSSPVAEGVPPSRRPAHRGLRIAFSSEPPEEVIAELSPRTIRAGAEASTRPARRSRLLSRRVPPRVPRRSRCKRPVLPVARQAVVPRPRRLERRSSGEAL